MKNKYDFIIELLEQKKITVLQRELLIKLAIQEFKNEDSKDIEIIKRISDIENILKISGDDKFESEQGKVNDNESIGIPEEKRPKMFNIIIKENGLNKEKQNKLTAYLPQYIDPSGLSRFLNEYNQDSILKGTCHVIDQDELDKINKECNTEEFNLKKYQELVYERFQLLAGEYIINPKAYALIKAYLTGGTKWSEEKIEISWASPDLMNWALNNPGKVPNPDESLENQLGFELIRPFNSILKGERINSFSKLVYFFKYLFHIRSDNSLRKFIELNNVKKKWKDKFEFEINNDEFYDNLELFTDVDKLIQAYNKILKIILEVQVSNNLTKPNIKLSFKNDNTDTLFSIHHKNSVYMKTIDNTLERIGSLQTNLIENQINGLCDLYIKADFGNNHFAEVNLWNGKPRVATKLSNFIGVEYILKFKK